MTGNTWYERIIAAHTAVTNNVSHSRRIQSDRYFVWQETGARDRVLGNRHAERAMTGTTWLVTNVEFDPWISALGDAFDASPYIAWGLVNAGYDPDNGLWSYQWDWTVADGG